MAVPGDQTTFPENKLDKSNFPVSTDAQAMQRPETSPGRDADDFLSKEDTESTEKENGGSLTTAEGETNKNSHSHHGQTVAPPDITTHVPPRDHIQEHHSLHSTHIPTINNDSVNLLYELQRVRQESESSEESVGSVEKEAEEIELICPRVNCPEKIVLCLDLSSAMEKVTFRSRSGDKFAPFKLVKRAMGIFMQTKIRLDKRHEFALVILKDVAMWAHDFTNNPRDIISFLDDLQETYPCESFDMGSLFDIIRKRVELPLVEDPETVPPPYTIRVLLIYGRSHCLPSFDNRESQRFLQASPHFFLDAYYVHEPPSEENQCEMIFDAICDLDDKGLSYVFEVSRNPTKLYDSMAQLLPHPLQRPLQKDASYSIRQVQEQLQ